LAYQVLQLDLVFKQLSEAMHTNYSNRGTVAAFVF